MDIDEIGSETQRPGASKKSEYLMSFCKALVVLGIIGMMITAWVFIFIRMNQNQTHEEKPSVPLNHTESMNLSQSQSESESRDLMVCGIREPMDLIPYPYPESFGDRVDYYVAFNHTIMQPRYVKYIQPLVSVSCKQCGYFKKDPYQINQLSHEDYTNTGYDRGHLVPNADLGVSTYYISNVVPMVPGFNRGIWKTSEQEIRDRYRSKLIYKGCEYSDKFLVTQRNLRLFVPVGCWFIVLNTSQIDQVNGLEVLDYGYYENKNQTVLVKKIPQWFDCE
jgi:DNA/RNA endonuclease G (NUC1)